MGRKKITITRIQDERNRQITFSKRKAGLLKKAYELSILCDVEIAVIMITSNKKLYQYASSNMNSILIRYTEFKDPDESKTNADILDDITKKEKGGGGGHDESGDEDSAHTNFLVTPHTQENFRKIDEEFDHLLRQNQIPPQPQPVHGIQTPLGSAPASMNVPAVMPVSVPVSSTSSVHRTIHQHLKGQMQQLESQRSSGSSAGPLSSGPMSANSSVASLFSPQSDLSSGSPAGPGGKTGQRSPMPPPQNTPTRLQTIRNQTLKLHLPGSGRNYISLPGPGSGKGGSEEGGANQNEGMDDAGEEVEGQDDGAGGGADKGNRPGAKPQLRVYIPGQKEFVPRTQATSPLAPVGLSTPAGGGGGVTQAPAIAGQTTTNAESLTTPILSLTTPNVFSSLPPLFSSIMGDFPFGQLPPGGASAGASTAVGAGGNPGGGGDGSSSAALVAFPVSIQPSASGAGMGNIVLQAQNMGQPFLLTPTYDRSTNPLLNSQGPPSSLAGAGGGSGGGGGAGGVVGQNSMRDLEQLKQQYERTTQIIQQQLLLSQMTSMMQQQQQQQHSQQTQQASQHHRPPGGQGPSTVTEETQDGDVDVGGGRQMETDGISVSATTLGGRGGGETEGGGGQGGPGGGSSSGAAIMRESGLGTSRETDAEIQANQFINGSDVMIGSRSQSDSLLRRTREGRDLGGEDLTSKRPRLDTSVSAL